MSIIPGGEFAYQEERNDHEEEKIHYVDEKHGAVDSDSPHVFGEEDADDNESRGGHAPESPPGGVHPPPAGARTRQQRRQQPPPPPTSVTAPKPLSSPWSDSPVKSNNLGGRLNSFLPPTASSPPPRTTAAGGEGEDGGSPANVPDDKSQSSHDYDDGGGGYHRDERTNQSNRHNHRSPASSASLVVCGVDGTVYTLDAYTGQLRGMFASGPALVHSSSPDESAATENNDRQSDDDEGFSYDDDVDGIRGDDSLNGDTSSAISSDASRDWKERVVPGLDGKLYSLIEMVDGSLEDEYEGDGDIGECNDDDDVCKSDTSDDDADGNSILPRSGTYNLTPLPISAMDVVDSPISTCRPSDGDADQQQCGIIVGSKKTTIYAIDPATGKVRWTQDPNGGAGGRGFTAHPPKSTSPRGRTVLLQREDYAVRHLDTDGGREVWRVELGRFSALDFDMDAGRGAAGGRSSDGMQYAPEDDGDSDDGDHVVRGRRRGAAAAAASVGSNDRKGSVPPILGGRKTAALHDFDSGFGDEHHSNDHRKGNMFGQSESEFDHDHSLFRGFPSIAFGEDGTSLIAVDGISGELLWKRRIESVVAGVYGVGKDSSWIHLDVIEEGDIFTHSHSGAQSVGLLPAASHPTESPHSGGLVPYGAGQEESGKLHRLGRHHKNLFVSPKFDSAGGFDTHISDDEPDEYSQGPDHSFLPSPEVNSLKKFHPTNDDAIFTVTSPGMTMADDKPPPSQVLDSGLYLTWSMVAVIAMLVLAVVVFVGRVVYIRQKKKLENTPSLDPTAAPSDDGKERPPSSGGLQLPPAVQKVPGPSSGNNVWSKNPSLFTRSFSLDALGSKSMDSPIKNIAQHFITGKDEATISPPNLTNEMPLPKPTLGERGISTPSTPTAAATTGSPLFRSKTLDDSPVNELDIQRPRQPSIDNIDGVPLVRYSRYRSEFQVISPLGSGGFGTVFRCKNTLDGRHYAIKKIKIISQMGLDGTATKHFSQKLHRVLREVKILALLDHDNIVRYYTAWLETDEGIQNDDGESNASSSIFGGKSNGFFSSSLFSGFGSNSRMPMSLSPQRTIHQRQAKGFNPLGWNNFGSSFRLDESKSEASSAFGAEPAEVSLLPKCGQEDDLGFTWERSNDVDQDISRTASKLNDKNAKEEGDDLGFKWERSHGIRTDSPHDVLKEDGSHSSSVISSVDSTESADNHVKESGTSKAAMTPLINDSKKEVKLTESKNDEIEKKTMEGKHILFIQMQLCSSQTLADFLANRQARAGPISPSFSQNNNYAVDIPFALRLFGQVANGVKYVHKQGLIHRDLKPQNIFIDDAGNVKVGDFGLSRESASASDITDFDEFDENGEGGSVRKESLPALPEVENTAGVGTRAYASPEQMRGSDYDASTDVYSLGIILFELCHPMYTSMERYKEFSGLRKGIFPSQWNSNVKKAFPTMHQLLVQMISESAAERPSADEVSDHIDSLLREYSVQSLDKSWGKEGALLLRVEAEEKENVLTHTMNHIKDAAPNAKILQYGLRGQANLAIMEFAIEVENDARAASVEIISSRLHEHNMAVRQISNS